MTSLAVRPIDIDDDATLDAWMSVKATVFTSAVAHSAARREADRDRFRTQRLTAAFDGPTLAATFRSWDWQLTVPGGAVTADAVSSVTVLPTHRRRGALTALISADLAAAVERDVPVAVLIASEATIYGRFGFGPATQAATWELDRVTARIAPGVPRPGTLELLTPQELRPLAPAVFAAARGPGATDRSDCWWDRTLDVAPMPGEPPAPPAAVLHRDVDGTPDGYLGYSWREDWRGRRCFTVATVHDLQAATGTAYAALWGFLAELDLVATVRAKGRPVDEPLPWLLTDSRAVRRTETADMLWVRILDPVTALSGRRYESPGRVVVEITDPLGHAAGTVALEVGADGAGSAAATADPPDVTLPVDVLSAAWLGGGDLLAAALAGRAAEHRPGARARFARMLRTTRAPWTGTWF